MSANCQEVKYQKAKNHGISTFFDNRKIAERYTPRERYSIDNRFVKIPKDEFSWTMLKTQMIKENILLKILLSAIFS